MFSPPSRSADSGVLPACHRFAKLLLVRSKRKRNDLAQ